MKRARVRLLLEIFAAANNFNTTDGANVGGPAFVYVVRQVGGWGPGALHSDCFMAELQARAEKIGG